MLSITLPSAPPLQLQLSDINICSDHVICSPPGPCICYEKTSWKKERSAYYSRFGVSLCQDLRSTYHIFARYQFPLFIMWTSYEYPSSTAELKCFVCVCDEAPGNVSYCIHYYCKSWVVLGEGNIVVMAVNCNSGTGTELRVLTTATSTT